MFLSTIPLFVWKVTLRPVIALFQTISHKAYPLANMEAALNQVKQLAATADKATRQQLMATLHEVAYSMEDAEDTVNRFGYLVSMPVLL